MDSTILLFLVRGISTQTFIWEEFSVLFGYIMFSKLDPELYHAGIFPPEDERVVMNEQLVWEQLSK